MAETEHKLKITTEYEDKSSAGIKSAQTQILDFAKAAERAGKDVSKAFDAQANAGKKSSKSLTDSFISLKASTLATGAAVVALGATFYKLIKQYTEAEEATRKFTFALKSSGITSDLAVNKFKAFAQSIQNTTKYSDEAVLSLGTLLTSAGVGFKDLETASKAAIQLAARYGKSLDEAGQLVVRSFSGQTRELKFLIPGMENLSEAQLRAGEGAKLILSYLGGSAEAERGTLLGAFSAAKNAVGELAESLGSLLSPVIDAVTKGFNFLTQKVNSFVNAIGVYKNTGVDLFKSQLGQLQSKRSDLAGIADSGTSSASARMQAEQEILAIDKQIAGMKRIISDIENQGTKELAKQVKLQNDKKASIEFQRVAEEKRKELTPKIDDLKKALDKELNTKLQYIEIEKQERLKLIDEALKYQKMGIVEAEVYRKKIQMSAENQEKLDKFNQFSSFVEISKNDPLSAVGAGIGAAFGGPVGAEIGKAIPGLIRSISEMLPTIIQDSVSQAGSLVGGLLKGVGGLFKNVFTGFGLFGGGPKFHDDLASAIAEHIDKSEFARAITDLARSIGDVANSLRSDASNLQRAKDRLDSVASKRGGALDDLFKSVRARSKTSHIVEGPNGTENRVLDFSGNLSQAISQGFDLNNLQFNVKSKKFQEALKGLGEQLKEEASAIVEYTNLRIRELDRLKSARENAGGIFQNAIESVSGALKSPEQTVADLMSQFGSASGEAKANIGTKLAGALQQRFQAAQQLASQGAISGEELQRIQAEVLGQLGDVQSQSLSEFDRMIMQQEAIKDAALKQVDYLESILTAIKDNNIDKLVDFFKNAPKFAQGSSYVRNTGFAMVHEGEQITPRGGATGLVININGGSSNMKEEVVKAVKEALKANTFNIKGVSRSR